MQLRLIERGTRLVISTLSEEPGIGDVYDATFHDMHNLINETSFVAKCPKLNRDYDSYDKNAIFEISFALGSNIYSFRCRAIAKKGNDFVIIELTSDIDELNRRKYQRDEIRVEVYLYALTEESINERRHTRPSDNPVMVEMSFDISVGGMCIVTNESLNQIYDPYYLVEFSLSDKDTFLLPVKLVRRSNYARSRVGKYDYGFEFIFNETTDEKSRLTKAILRKKLPVFR